MSTWRSLPFPVTVNPNGSLACVAEPNKIDPKPFPFTIPVDIVEKATSVQLTIYCQTLLSVRNLIVRGDIQEANVWLNLRKRYHPELLRDPRSRLPLDGSCNRTGCTQPCLSGPRIFDQFCSVHTQHHSDKEEKQEESEVRLS